jgi:hypothetical protein
VAVTWVPAYGSPVYGAYSVRSGVTVRMGLIWAADPGPVYLTVSAGIIPSSLVREHPTRELSTGSPAHYETTEWITVTATSSTGWVEDIGLSYFGTYDAEEIRGAQHHVVAQPSYHLVAAEGRVLALVRAAPLSAAAPRPILAAVTDGHTAHLDVRLGSEPTDRRHCPTCSLRSSQPGSARTAPAQQRRSAAGVRSVRFG